MAGKKLNRRQQWRIEKIQTERQARAERAQQKGSALERSALEPEEFGVLVSHFGQQIEIEDASGERLRCYARSNLPDLVCGDNVVFQRNSANALEGIIVARGERRSELLRPDTHGRANAPLKPVAANIDLINVVIAPEPTPSVSMLDRYLIACELCHIPALVIFNKHDLPGAGDIYRTFRHIYRHAGLDWISVSAHDADSLELLAARLAQRNSVFVGQSGVGKSSLINALIPDLAEQQRVNTISAQSRLGQHTTTAARLFHFPKGGILIDSPGIREFGLWHVEAERIPWCYAEATRHLGQCRFRDCRHESEPGCAVQKAVAEGLFPAERFASMQQLMCEAEAGGSDSR